MAMEGAVLSMGPWRWMLPW